MRYTPQTGLREARENFFRVAGFPEDGGYNDRWIKVRYLRFPVWLPNVESRRRAVPLHDLHHILTEYPTTWRGEAEISTWEVASGGLKGSWAGWILTLMNVAQGLVINPRGVHRAFMRGRQTGNLFGREFDERMLDSKVGEMRSTLRLDKPLKPSTAADHAAFVFWIAVSVALYLTVVLVPAFLLFFGLRFLLVQIGAI